MAGIDVSKITRDEIAPIVWNAHANARDPEQDVRAYLASTYPGIEALTIRVNTNVVNVVDYLVTDLDSYGSGP